MSQYEPSSQSGGTQDSRACVCVCVCVCVCERERERARADNDALAWLQSELTAIFRIFARIADVFLDL